MLQVSIQEAENQLATLVERGSSFVVVKAGKPIATVVPYPQRPEVPASKRVGFMSGEIMIPDDFDSMFADEIAELFEGSER